MVSETLRVDKTFKSRGMRLWTEWEVIHVLEMSQVQNLGLYPPATRISINQMRRE